MERKVEAKMQELKNLHHSSEISVLYLMKLPRRNPLNFALLFYANIQYDKLFLTGIFCPAQTLKLGEVVYV